MIRNKTGMSAFSTSVQHCTGGSSQYKHATKTSKRHQGWKERSTTISTCGIHQKTIKANK